MIDNEISLENTILEHYQTVIFDIDQTLLDCFSPSGESIGCYSTVAPYTLLSKNVVKDIKGNIIRLQQHVRDFLDILDENDINLGICSRGEKRDTPFAAQPTTMILKKFDIYKYFNLDVILKEKINKYEYVKPVGKTLFIDDSDEQLQNVSANPKIDILNRKSFDDWFQLLQPMKLSSLNFGLNSFMDSAGLRLG